MHFVGQSRIETYNSLLVMWRETLDLVRSQDATTRRKAMTHRISTIVRSDEKISNFGRWYQIGAINVSKLPKMIGTLSVRTAACLCLRNAPSGLATTLNRKRVKLPSTRATRVHNASQSLIMRLKCSLFKRRLVTMCS